jgi:hypothetical protein
MIKSLGFALLLGATLVACTGADGKDGANGTNGTDGMDGADGMDGMDGMDGQNGTGGAGVRTVVVSPGASATASGTNLINALTVFKNDPAKASATNHWLIKLEPGVYDVGAATAEMQPFVDLEGSGELTTTIKGTGVTLTTANGVELRDLTVSCTGNCAAIVNDGDSPLISRVTAQLTSTQLNAAIVNVDGSPTLRDVLVVASGVDAQGIEIDAGAPFLRDVDVVASGSGTTGPGGINIFDGTAFIADSTVSATGNPATSPAIAIYVGRSVDESTIDLDDVYVSASANVSVALQVESIVTTAAQGVRVRDSVLVAGTAISLTDNEAVFVAAANTQLNGDVEVGTDNQNFVICTGDYDGLFSPLVDGVADTANAGGACLLAP